MVISDIDSTFIHIFSRNVFALAYLVSIAKLARVNAGIVWINVAIAVADIIIYFGMNPEWITTFYRYHYFLFPLETAYFAWKFARSDSSKRYPLISASIVFYAIAQVYDYFALFVFSFGSNFGPAIVALVIGMHAYIAISGFREYAALNGAIGKILRAMGDGASVRSSISSVASMIRDQTGFARVSAYVDGYYLGIYDKPAYGYRRIVEDGYRKDTRKDFDILCSDGRGTVMQSAMERGEIEVGRGERDDGLYAVVPIGKGGCINLSDDFPRSEADGARSMEILNALVPSLAPLEMQLIEQGKRRGFSINKLVSVYGLGTREVEMGCLFLDVNDCDRLSKRYGDAYMAFLRAKFFPALDRFISDVAVVEDYRGDAANILCIKDLLSPGLNVWEAAFATLVRVKEFVEGPGLKLANENGFEGASVSIGFAIGKAIVICDEKTVSVAGDLINNAARVLAAAGRGQTLMLADGNFSDLAVTSAELGEEFEIIQKQTRLKVREVRLYQSVEAVSA